MPLNAPSSDCQTSPLALLGGPKAIESEPEDLFAWPIITEEDEAAILDVLRRREMSGTAITMEFEKDFAAWQGSSYALGFNNGTAALLAAMFGLGVGHGDEILCPATTYWASALPCFSLGATPVFCDVEEHSLCLDPADIERHISERTKAIVVVHYLGYPADMDPIMKIARQHNLKVIEDVSHAHGALYKGKKTGGIGDVGCFSMMSGKPLAIGEAGMLTTNNREVYEKAVAFGHYERFDARIQSPALVPYRGLPIGGYKNRMHQMSAAMGRVQLRHYDARCAKIRKAMNYFWDLLEGLPGIRAHRVDEAAGSTMGGWYCAHGLYRSEELHGLSVTRFCEAIRAEGVSICQPGCNRPLHRHPILNELDIYHEGAPTRIAHSKRDLRQPAGSLPVAEAIVNKTFFVPWFKHLRKDAIELYANVFRKVLSRAGDLLASDEGNPPSLGDWHFFARK